MIKRQIFDELKNHCRQKEITLIAGPRQAGKTTVMNLLKDDLDSAGEKTLFLSLDIEHDRQFFASQEKLLSKIRLEIGNEQGYVFLDEIQRKEDAGLFLKGLYDMDLPYKFIVSGSGSLELKEKIHESLAGRKRVFELSTLSFGEFVHYKTEYRYEQKLQDFLEVEHEKAKELLEEYFHFGGYPRVVLASTLKEKQAAIAEIYQAYLERDISQTLGVQKEEAFTHLVRILASQAGNLVNISELSATLGISTKTVQHYVWYLEKTFVVRKLTPYYKNIRKELTKSPIYYFSDLGLRNYAAGEFGRVDDSSPSMGFLLENLVFNTLEARFSRGPVHIHFWRTKEGAEVDFILDKVNEVIPVEVKYKTFQKPELERSFKSFLAKYNPKQAYLVNLNLDQGITVGKTKVSFIPFHKLLFLSFD